MKGNELLIWMSARSEGSWQQFKGAIEELHFEDPGSPDAEDSPSFPLYQQIRMNLERLGHCEFYATGNDKDWRVAPRVLAAVQQKQECWGFYCGARSSKTIRKFTDQAGTALEIQSGVWMPDTLKVRSNSESQLRTIAETAGLLFQSRAPTTLLMHISAVDYKMSNKPSDLPRGRDWKIERFVPDKLAWEQSSAAEPRSGRLALYRFTFRFERHHYLCSRGNAYAVSGQAGKYIALRRSKKSVLRYIPNSEQLRVPAVCRPPILIERALTLCSGCVPIYDAATAEVIYDHIPREVAELAAQQLRQDLG